jgi:hypothetical protein
LAVKRLAVLTFSAAIATALSARAQDAAPAASATSSVVVSAQPNAGPAAVHGGVFLSGSTGSPVGDVFLNLLTLGIYATAMNDQLEAQHEMLEDSWVQAVQRRRADREDSSGFEQRGYGPYGTRVHRDAREGFLFSFGLGGGAVRYSDPSYLGGGALNFGLRMGYGFSDRFQLFGDFSADAAFYSGSREINNWLVTLRGQTVLIGDTAGNGLNLNLGFGLGGITIHNSGGFPDYSSGAGPALVGGLSYDARVGRRFALSPEFYVSWHPVPNGAGFPDDNFWSTGVRLNFLWYSPVY